jgi:hypothetical protein
VKHDIGNRAAHEHSYYSRVAGSTGTRPSSSPRLREARDSAAASARALAREAVARDDAEAGSSVVGVGRRGAFGGWVLDAGLHRSFLAKRGTSDAWSRIFKAKGLFPPTSVGG